MKTLITPNLLKFTLTTAILTIIFRIGLSTSITSKMIIAVVISALVYAIFMWFNGFYFGKKEYEYLPIYDIGFTMEKIHRNWEGEIRTLSFEGEIRSNSALESGESSLV